MKEHNAKDIMNKKVIKINENSIVQELAKLLLDNKISGVPVINDQEKLVGIVSKSDIVIKGEKSAFPLFFGPFENYIFFESKKALEKYEGELQSHLKTKIKDIMTKDVKIVNIDTPVSRVANIMITNNINRIPVVDNEDKLVGIIARADILKVIKEIL